MDLPIHAPNTSHRDQNRKRSVFGTNRGATRDFIPQVDAAILVIGADPPISGEELALIEALAANVDRILIVHQLCLENHRPLS